MRESVCHCEEWRRLQKAQAKKGFIMDVAAGIVLKNLQAYLQVYFMGKQSSLCRKYSKDYLLYKIKIKLKK